MNQFDISLTGTLKEQLNEVEQVALQILTGKVLEMAHRELPKQISKNIGFSNVVLSNTTLKAIKTNDLVPAMLIKGADRETKKIPFLLLCKQALMRTLVDSIMGLEASESTEINFDEFDLSAASEMVNALFQQAAMSMSEVANREMNGLNPSVGLFKNFGDFLQTLRLTSEAAITQIQFDLTVEDASPSPCLIVIDFKAVSKFIGEIGPIAMDSTPMNESNSIAESMSEDQETVESMDTLEMEETPTIDEPVSTTSGGGMMSQDAIEAMLAKKAAEAANANVESDAVVAPTATPTPSPTPSSGGGKMSQDAIEAMLAKKAAEAAAPKATTGDATSFADSGGKMSQDAIEAMLAKRNLENAPTSIPTSTPTPAPTPTPVPVPTPSNDSGKGKMSQDEIEAMMAGNTINSMLGGSIPTNNKSIVSLHDGPGSLPVAPSIPHQVLEDAQAFFPMPMIHSNMNLVMNVPLTISVEIGKTTKKIKEILDFQPGTVIELDKQNGTPMDVIVNGELFARGEVVVLEENFGVRLTEIHNRMNEETK